MNSVQGSPIDIRISLHFRGKVEQGFTLGLCVINIGRGLIYWNGLRVGRWVLMWGAAMYLLYFQMSTNKLSN